MREYAIAILAHHSYYSLNDSNGRFPIVTIETNSRSQVTIFIVVIVYQN